MPDDFGLDPEQSTVPTRGLAEDLSRRAETALGNLRVTIKEQAARSTAEIERVQAWLKSEEAKELLRQSPGLKEVFSAAAAAAKSLPKEEDAALAAQTKALEKVQSQLASFRRASRK